MPVKGKVSEISLKLYLYIMDACHDIAPNKIGMMSHHYQKQKILRTVFERYFECEITPVIFPRGTKPEAVLAHWHGFLATKTENHLVIVYYHGRACWNGEEYSVRYEGFPKKDVDMYEFIKFAVKSRAQVQFILDAWIPDRFADKWKHVANGGTNNVEIIARGEPMQDTDGSILEQDASDFTLNLAVDLEKFMKNIDVPAKEGGFAGYKAPISIPGILKPNTKLVSNPRRLWLKRTNAASKRYVARFVLLPTDMRKRGKYRWFLKHIQGRELKGKESDEQMSQSLFMPLPWQDEEEDEDEDEDEEEDEGYAEDPEAANESAKVQPDGTSETSAAPEDRT